MNLDIKFKSELTLKFDETRIKQITKPIEIHDVGGPKSDLGKNITIRQSIYTRQ